MSTGAGVAIHDVDKSVEPVWDTHYVASAPNTAHTLLARDIPCLWSIAANWTTQLSPPISTEESTAETWSVCLGQAATTPPRAALSAWDSIVCT